MLLHTHARTSMRLVFTLLLAATFSLSVNTKRAEAQECYMGQVIWTAANFCPRGWLQAKGQTLQIGSHQALWSTMGTMYGGDGRTTFKLPNLGGRSAIGPGSSPLSVDYHQGQSGGRDFVELKANQMPRHHHTISSGDFGNLRAQGSTANTDDPTDAFLAKTNGVKVYTKARGTNRTMAHGTVRLDTPDQTSSAGGTTHVDIRDPFVVLLPCVCTQGNLSRRSKSSGRRQRGPCPFGHAPMRPVSLMWRTLDSVHRFRTDRRLHSSPA